MEQNATEWAGNPHKQLALCGNRVDGEMGSDEVCTLCGCRDEKRTLARHVPGWWKGRKGLPANRNSTEASRSCDDQMGLNRHALPGAHSDGEARLGLVRREQ